MNFFAIALHGPCINITSHKSLNPSCALFTNAHYFADSNLLHLIK